MRKKILLLSLALPLLLTACGEPADTHPDKPVTQRRAAFNTILKAFEPMGMMLRDKRYDADAFLQSAEKLEATKEGPWRHFTADSNYPPTKATDKVWSEAAQFETERQGFLAATGQAAGSGPQQGRSQGAPGLRGGARRLPQLPQDLQEIRPAGRWEPARFLPHLASAARSDQRLPPSAGAHPPRSPALAVARGQSERQSFPRA